MPPSAVRTALEGRSVETPALARVVGHVAQGLPTDGVALPDGRLVIRDYEGATVYQPPAYDGKALVAQVRLGWPLQDQGETIAAIDGGRAVVVGSEGADQELVRVTVPEAPAAPTTGTGSAASPSSVNPSATSATQSSGGGAGQRLGIGLIARGAPLLLRSAGTFPGGGAQRGGPRRPPAGRGKRPQLEPVTGTARSASAPKANGARPLASPGPDADEGVRGVRPAAGGVHHPDQAERELQGQTEAQHSKARDGNDRGRGGPHHGPTDDARA